MSWRMDKNKFLLAGRLFNTTSPRLGAPTQRKARPQVGRPNATQGTSGSWVPKCTSAMQMQGTPACQQLGSPNATQGTSGSWAPKRNARRVRKMGLQTKNSSSTKTSTQGALGEKTSWRMDKNKFWLRGRLFNTASPRLGAPTQCKARPQVGRPNKRS